MGIGWRGNQNRIDIIRAQDSFDVGRGAPTDTGGSGLGARTIDIETPRYLGVRLSCDQSGVHLTNAPGP